MLASTFGHHKASKRWTWHTPNGQHHNQTDYILVRKRFRSGMNFARKRSFPGADSGSDHDLLMMTVHLQLRRISKRKHTRPRKAERTQCVGKLASYDMRDVYTSHLVFPITHNSGCITHRFQFWCTDVRPVRHVEAHIFSAIETIDSKSENNAKFRKRNQVCLIRFISAVLIGS